jgi:hypothetical protein
MFEKLQFSTIDIINAYEHTQSVSAKFFTALRESRKHGFKMYQYEYNDATSIKEYHAAVFCLSLCHRENILLKADLDSIEFRAALKDAVQQSQILKKDVDFLLTDSPSIAWNGSN